MANNRSYINEDNLTEWMHSVGYFLPRNDVEFMRFEKLHCDIKHSLNVEDVDPFSIIDGSWKRKVIIQIFDGELNQQIEGLRLAARKNDNIPENLVEKLRRNQRENGESDNTQG